MTAYVIQRVLLTIPVILLAVTLVFLAGHAVPDYAVRSTALGLTGAENLEEAKEQVRHDLGLDKPLLQQYGANIGAPAARQAPWLHYVFRFVSILGLALPAFYLGVLLLIFVFKVFDWAPPLTTTAYRDLWEDPVQNLKQMALPAIAGGLRLGAAP